MKRIVVLALSLVVVLGLPALAGTLPGPVSVAPSGPEAGGLWVPVQRRCYPSRCTCRGSRPAACSRDCRRDRVCSCTRSKYVCSLYVSG